MAGLKRVAVSVRHVQRTPHLEASAGHASTPPAGTRIFGIGCHADQGAYLASIEMAEFRQFRNQDRRGDTADARHIPPHPATAWT